MFSTSAGNFDCSHGVRHTLIRVANHTRLDFEPFSRFHAVCTFITPTSSSALFSSPLQRVSRLSGAPVRRLRPRRVVSPGFTPARLPRRPAARHSSTSRPVLPSSREESANLRNIDRPESCPRFMWDGGERRFCGGADVRIGSSVSLATDRSFDAPAQKAPPAFHHANILALLHA